MRITKLLPLAFISLSALTSCNKNYKEYKFQYWNESTSLNKLKDFVKRAVDPSDKERYVPVEDRIATFDMDGTLYGERAPIYVEWLMYMHRYNDKTVDDAYRAPITLPLRAHKADWPKDKFEDIDYTIPQEEIYNHLEEFCNTREIVEREYQYQDYTVYSSLEMEEAYAGALLFSDMTVKEYSDYATNFLKENVKTGFNNATYNDMWYLPMKEVINFLKLNDFTVYICSGTDRILVRNMACKELGIPTQNVIGMDVQLEYDEDAEETYRTSKLIVKNVEDKKAEQLAQELGKEPVLSFGNSGGDVLMHEYTLNNPNYYTEAYMVNNDDNDREFIQDRKEKWADKPYTIFSMKNDWKTIYTEKVTRIK